VQVSREYAIAELTSVRDTLSNWIKDLDNPTAINRGGLETAFYPDGVPISTSVSDLEGIPVHQLRAELLAIAGKLESLAAT